MSAAPPKAAGPGPALQLVGCSILRKELDLLLRKNGWQVERRLLDSALHYYLNRLSVELEESLAAGEREGRGSVVLYGCCHPLIDRILRKHGAVRTRGQNCIAMLLGQRRFMEELSRGAYFLLEEWALGWEPMITATFGKNPAVVREIFQSSHRLIIALRTPCSGDFTAAAEAAARSVGLPLEWMDADLDVLEAALAEALSRAGAPGSQA